MFSSVESLARATPGLATMTLQETLPESRLASDLGFRLDIFLLLKPLHCLAREASIPRALLLFAL